MTKRDVLKKLNTLNLPKESYVVFGAGTLAILGIREVNDIDLFVSPETYKLIQEKGWQKIQKGHKDAPYTYDVFEAHDNWNFSEYNPTLTEMLSRAIEIDGIFFASLDDVKKWKAASKRPKDIEDLKRIEKYLEKAL